MSSSLPLSSWVDYFRARVLIAERTAALTVDALFPHRSKDQICLAPILYGRVQKPSTWLALAEAQPHLSFILESSSKSSLCASVAPILIHSSFIQLPRPLINYEVTPSACENDPIPFPGLHPRLRNLRGVLREGSGCNNTRALAWSASAEHKLAGQAIVRFGIIRIEGGHLAQRFPRWI